MREPRCAAVDWNWTEFINDSAVRAMSPRSLGLYVRLLAAARDAEKVGWIGGDEATMKRLSGATDDEWRECGLTVLARFHAVDGGFLHSRTRKEHEAESTRIMLRKNHASLAAKSRWDKRFVPGALPVQCPTMLSSVTPSLLHSQNLTPLVTDVTARALSPKARKPRTPRQEHPDFAEWWASAPKRVDRIGAAKAYDQAVREGATPELLLAGIRRYATEVRGRDSKHVKHPETWLHKSWRDEPNLALVSDDNPYAAMQQRVKEARAKLEAEDAAERA